MSPSRFFERCEMTKRSFRTGAPTGVTGSWTLMLKKPLSRE